MKSEQETPRHSRFEEEMEKINQAVVDYESGQSPDVAIISEPLAGRSTLLEEVKRLSLPTT